MDRRGFLRLPAALAGAALVPNLAKAQEPSRPRYRVLDRPMPITKGPVSLIEVFNFRSKTCYDMEPEIKDFVAELGNKVHFTRLYLSIEQIDVRQRFYCTLDEMGQADRFVDLIFYEMYEKKNYLNDLQGIADFVSLHGLDRARFINYYDSFNVQMMISQTDRFLSQPQFIETPTFIVDGRMVTSATYAGVRPADLIPVVREMIAGA